MNKFVGKSLITSIGLLGIINVTAQKSDSIFVQQVVAEVSGNSQLKKLAIELLDGIGPRLVGTPEMQQANDWAVKKYNDWGITAKNEKWGDWMGWKRGISHIDMVYPRVKSLEGQMLALSPSTNGKPITAETIIIPDLADSNAFKQWLPDVKGKIVLISMEQPTGRPDDNWEHFGLKESIENMKKERLAQRQAWQRRIRKTGLTSIKLQHALEHAGAVGLVESTWSNGWGSNDLYEANTKRIPTVQLSLEDYGLLYRLTDNNYKPKISIRTESKELGYVPAFNTIAEIRGTEKPDEYVILSAHFDSYDGASGATDNGTGTLMMMETMRILKKYYPNPKRTILVGHWGSEEQGWNGSRSFVEDHPEILPNIQAVFNQDNGTGRIISINAQGFAHAYEYLQRWLSKTPDSVRGRIQIPFPISQERGTSDHISFVAAGVPAFSLSSLDWDYARYTWHTTKDTYDKIVWDDLKNNVILTAILVYMASEDPDKTPREKAVLPINPRTGKRFMWPQQMKAVRKGDRDL